MTLDASTVAVHEVQTEDEAASRADITVLKVRLVIARKFAAEAEAAYGEKYKNLIGRLEGVRAEWERENALVVAEHERTKEYLEKTDKEIRQAVVDYCKEHDVKKFDEHLSVRVLTKLEYDEEAATAWAKTNAPFILVADKKQFEGIAKKQDLDFVTKTPAYTAVIASELPDLSNEGQEVVAG